MFSVQHGGKEYEQGVLIPVDLGSLHVGHSKFSITFYCRSKCQTVGSLRLGVSFFTRNIPRSADEEVFGVHQENCDVLYPLEIK